jgi:hypothetical protein
VTRWPGSILPAILALAAATLGVASPPALAGSRDRAATRAYIRAGYTALHAAKVNLAASRNALASLERQITSQCPLAAAGSPQDEDSEQLSNELVGALTVAAYHPDAGVIATFAHAVRGLRWSNPTLTRTVRTSTTKLSELSTLAVPDVCSDIQAWAASGFQTLPASAVQFDQRYAAVDVEAEEVPLRLLAPYEDASSASQLHRVERLEAAIAEFEAHAVAFYTRIMDRLELNQ